MNLRPLNFESLKHYFPHVLMVGVGIGTINFILHGEFNWLQWVIQSVSTSSIIGFSLLLVASNKAFIKQYLKQNWTLYLVLIIVYILVGIIATEVEALIKNLIFRTKTYMPFSSGNMLLTNSIFSLFLGFSFLLNDRLFSKASPEVDQGQAAIPNQKKEPETELITKIPVKKGENIQLISVHDVVYFEAFDNYSNLYHSNGKKMLCDYSLLFLEKRLDKDFLRIHRKYIVNTTHIKQIIPHLNGRFLIEFNNSIIDRITSSKGYLKTMRKLVKIE